MPNAQGRRSLISPFQSWSGVNQRDNFRQWVSKVQCGGEKSGPPSYSDQSLPPQPVQGALTTGRMGPPRPRGLTASSAVSATNYRRAPRGVPVALTGPPTLHACTVQVG